MNPNNLYMFLIQPNGTLAFKGKQEICFRAGSDNASAIANALAETGVKISMVTLRKRPGIRRKSIRTAAAVAMTAAVALGASVLTAGSAQADDPDNPGYHQLQVYAPSDAKSFSVVTRVGSGEKGHISKCVDTGGSAKWYSVGLVKNGDTVESWGYNVNCDSRTTSNQKYYKKVSPSSDSLTNYWLDLTK